MPNNQDDTPEPTPINTGNDTTTPNPVGNRSRSPAIVGVEDLAPGDLDGITGSPKGVEDGPGTKEYRDRYSRPPGDFRLER